MDELPDWDLLAVVRSCCTTTSATSLPLPKQEELFYGFPTLFEPPTTSFSQLQDICMPRLIPATITTTTTSSSSNFVHSSPVSSSSSSLAAGRSFLISETPNLRRLIRPSQVVFGAPPAASTSQAQKTKKRKNLVKKVCHVPAEGLSNDMWAWRKYGQKPIKGSPYPRGYYRCSSSKGCLARKQVERNRSDPKVFIVTYTGEHNHCMPTHRNSLAGSTRQKSLSGDTPAQEQPTCSSPSAGASVSPQTESKIEEDDDMGISDLMLNDDFYVGFEKIDGDDDDECFSDHFSPSMEFPWLSSSSSTATAAGGL